MKKLFRALALLPLLAHSGPGAFGAEAAPAAPHPAAELLPAGTYSVEVLTPQVTERQAELLLRFQKATQANPQWFVDYAKANSKVGEALRYHPNFGLSAEEYSELQTFLAESRMVVGGKATLKVTSDSAGRLTLDDGATLSDLTGIVIDLAKDQVETPFGVAGPRQAVAANDRQKEVGPWTGFSWSFETPGKTEAFTPASSLATVKFSLGRLQEDGRGVLYYKARSIAGGKTTSRVSYTLLYDLPAASGGAAPAPAGANPLGAKPAPPGSGSNRRVGDP